MGQRGARSRRTLFERESELAAVDEALSELTGLRRDGTEPPGTPRGALLAFAGRAGLGKTTLLAEVRRRAAAKGCTVLSARGGDQEQRVAFHVARQLLQPQLAGASGGRTPCLAGQLVRHRRPRTRPVRARRGRPARPAGPARRPRLGAHPSRRAARPDRARPRRRALGRPRVAELARRVRAARRGTAAAARRRLPARRTPRPRRGVPGTARPRGTAPPRPRTAQRRRRRPSRTRDSRRPRRRRVLPRMLGGHRGQPVRGRRADREGPRPRA